MNCCVPEVACGGSSSATNFTSLPPSNCTPFPRTLPAHQDQQNSPRHLHSQPHLSEATGALPSCQAKSKLPPIPRQFLLLAGRVLLAAGSQFCPRAVWPLGASSEPGKHWKVPAARSPLCCFSPARSLWVLSFLHFFTPCPDRNNKLMFHLGHAV